MGILIDISTILGIIIGIIIIYKERSEIKSIYKKIYAKIYGEWIGCIFPSGKVIGYKRIGIITSTKNKVIIIINKLKGIL